MDQSKSEFIMYRSLRSVGFLVALCVLLVVAFVMLINLSWRILPTDIYFVGHVKGGDGLPISSALIEVTCDYMPDCKNKQWHTTSDTNGDYCVGPIYAHGGGNIALYLADYTQHSAYPESVYADVMVTKGSHKAIYQVPPFSRWHLYRAKLIARCSLMPIQKTINIPSFAWKRIPVNLTIPDYRQSPLAIKQSISIEDVSAPRDRYDEGEPGNAPP